MPRVLVGDLEPRRGFEGFVIVHGLEQGLRFRGILPGIQGEYLFVAVAFAFFVLPFGFHLLDVRAVQKHDLQKITGGSRAVDVSLEALLHHTREQSGMVDMGMGYQNEIHRFGRVSVGLEIPFLDLAVALMHAAINGKTNVSGLNHVAGTGDGLRGAQKRDFHNFLPNEIFTGSILRRQGFSRHFFPSRSETGAAQRCTPFGYTLRPKIPFSGKSLSQSSELRARTRCRNAKLLRIIAPGPTIPLARLIHHAGSMEKFIRQRSGHAQQAVSDR